MNTSFYAGYGLWPPVNRFPSKILTVSSPVQVFTEPISLDQAKAFLKVPPRSPVDSAEDALIATLISAARSVAEEEQELELIQRQWDFYFDYWTGPLMELGNPLVSVDLVQYRDSNGNVTVLNPNTDYIVDTNKRPGVLATPYGATWPGFTPWPSSALLIRATTGFAANDPWWTGDDGKKTITGMSLLISDWFNNRLPYETPLADYPYTLKVLLGGGAIRAR